MPRQINIEELKTLIANGIKEENLQSALPEDAVERIKNRIISANNKEKSKEIPDVVSELDVASFPVGGGDRKFPQGEMISNSIENQNNFTGETDNFFVEPGSESTDQAFEPKMGYTPELPEMIKNAEPAEVFVFKYSDLNQTGENLTYKSLRMMDDPDVMKSMQDLWLKHGKTKACVYVAKFEKIGEIDFDYRTGVSKFIEKASEPDYAGGTEFRDNPYAEPSLPQIDSAKKNELETYIKSSIDLDGVVRDIVMNVLKDSLSNNNQANNYSLGAINPNEPNIPTDEQGMYVNEDNSDSLTEKENVTMKEIAESDDYEKIILPKELNESINSGDKKMLVSESEDVQKWSFEGKFYFTPTGRISKDKGYIKK